MTLENPVTGQTIDVVERGADVLVLESSYDAEIRLVSPGRAVQRILFGCSRRWPAPAGSTLSDPRAG